MSIPTVLIIDDSKYDRLLYREYLGTNNFNIRELKDGEKVLLCLEDEMSDLILLDWQMPNVDGLETLKILNRSPQYKDIPVIVITGFDKKETLELAFNYGATDFIQKPVDRIELKARVQNILQLKATQKELVDQKEEMKEIYRMMKEQKKDLERSVDIKADVLHAQEKKYKLEKEQAERDLNALTLQMQKMLNYVKKAKSMVRESLSPLARGTVVNQPDQTDIYQNLKSIRKILEKVDEEHINSLNYRKLLEATDEELVKKLLKINPKLTNLELRHCSYLKMNLSNHEIADIMNVELKSLQMSRYRIKKKLNYDTDLSLRELIFTL